MKTCAHILHGCTHDITKERIGALQSIKRRGGMLIERLVMPVWQAMPLITDYTACSSDVRTAVTTGALWSNAITGKQRLVKWAELGVQCILLLLINVFANKVIIRWNKKKLDQLALPRQASMHLNSGLSEIKTRSCPVTVRYLRCQPVCRRFAVPLGLHAPEPSCDWWTTI